MNNKKNIDRLFQEKFKDFEVAPNDAVWDRISESLPKKKKKRRVIALWWQIGGVAAVIALILTVGVSVFNSDKNNAQEFPIVNTEESEKNSKKNNTNSELEKNSTKKSFDKKQIELNTIEDKNTKVVNSNLDSEQKTNAIRTEDNTPQNTRPSNQLTNLNNSKQKSNIIANNYNKEQKTKNLQKPSNIRAVANKDKSTRIATQTKTSNPTLKTNDKSQLKSEAERKSAIKRTIKENKTVVVENSSSKQQDSETLKTDSNKTDDSLLENLIIEGPKKESIENAIAENKEIIEEEKEDEPNRWSIAPNVAPVYYGSLGEGSSLDQQFNENSKSSDINMSYGIAGSYAISKKLKIRTGVNRMSLNQTTTDVYAFTGAETAARGTDAAFKNISFKEGAQHVSLMSSKMMNRSSAPELFNTKFAGNIEQKFGFIEVPLELEYAVLDKKLGINIIGGFSTFILNENEIYADVNGASTLIGEANNINDTSFSANFGLGMDYSLSKQLNINLEPTFKYQINTFNNTTGDFRPFFIGVYTGLSYKF